MSRITDSRNVSVDDNAVEWFESILFYVGERQDKEVCRDISLHRMQKYGGMNALAMKCHREVKSFIQTINDNFRVGCSSISETVYAFNIHSCSSFPHPNVKPNELNTRPHFFHKLIGSDISAFSSTGADCCFYSILADLSHMRVSG